MPGYKTHLVGGAVAFGIAAFVTRHMQRASALSLAEWFISTLLGSLFPDVDTKSKGQGLFYRALLILMVWLFFTQSYQAAIVLSIAGMVPLLVHHRGLFHRAWFLLGCGLLALLWVYRASPLYALPFFWDVFYFFVGALSHIFLDTITTRSRS